MKPYPALSVLLLAVLTSAPAWAVLASDCSEAFPSAGQGSHQGNQGEFKAKATSKMLGTTVVNGRGRLGYHQNMLDIEEVSGDPAPICDGYPCEGTNTSSAPFLPDNRCVNDTCPDGVDVTVPANTTATLPAGTAFNTITVQDGATLTLRPGITIKTLKLTSSGSRRAKVLMPAGDYSIDDLAVMAAGTEIQLIGTGAVRLFVHERLTFKAGSLINSPASAVRGDPSRLLLVPAQGGILEDGATLSGYVYTPDASSSDSLLVKSASHIFGRVITKYLTLEDYSVLDARGTTPSMPGCSVPPPTVSIDHYELDHAGSALTCSPTDVTVRACASVNTSPNAPCTDLVTTDITPTLIPADGWVGGNPFTIASGGAAVKQLRVTKTGPVTLGVSGSTPATINPTLCRSGGGPLSTAACTLTFADSGFLFDVLDTLANKPQQVQLKAVKKDNATQKCVPGFTSVSKPVSFWSDYVSPATNGFGSKMTVNDNAIATSQGAATASPQTLAFDAQGEATLTVSYPDAGQMRLNASHYGSGDTAGLVMTGSDPFVSRPAGLCITPAQGACAAGDASCPVFKKTGEAFPLSIGAVAWQADNDGDLCNGNLATPNFALAKIALGSQLVAPKPGVEAVVSKLSYDHGIAAGSNLNTVTQSVNEVGVFRMTAIPPTSGYFGYSLPAATSVPVGRFVPWDFHLVSGTITPACGGFSYMSQPFGVQTTVQARNQQGGVTQNYRDAFARGVIALVAANNKDGVDRSNRLDPLGASWQSGQSTFDGRSRFVRLRELTQTLTVPEEPLRALRLGVQVTDGEATATTFLTDRDMNPGVKGDCQVGVNCTARQLSIHGGSDDTMIAYYGRLLASTRQGVYSAPLALPLQVQYFEAGQWRVNQQDVCTQISLAGGGIAFTDPGQHYDARTGDLILQDGTRIRLGLGQVAPGGNQTRVDAGETRFHFGPPHKAVRIPYRILLERQPLAPLWLTDPAMPGHLLGEAIFGSSRGNDRIIYRRELMPQN